jgi:hypothetical protein
VSSKEQTIAGRFISSLLSFLIDVLITIHMPDLVRRNRILVVTSPYEYPVTAEHILNLSAGYSSSGWTGKI